MSQKTPTRARGIVGAAGIPNALFGTSMIEAFSLKKLLFKVFFQNEKTYTTDSNEIVFFDHKNNSSGDFSFGKILIVIFSENNIY